MQVAQGRRAEAGAQNAAEGEGETDGSEPELEAVDFFSPEEAASLLPASAAADRRFDSSSDDDGGADEDDHPGQQPVQAQAPGLESRRHMPDQDKGLAARHSTLAQPEGAPALQQRSQAQEGCEAASRGGLETLQQGAAGELPAGTSSEEHEPAAALGVGHALEHSSDHTQVSSRHKEGGAAPGPPSAQSSSAAEESSGTGSSHHESTPEQSQDSASEEPETAPLSVPQEAEMPDQAGSSGGEAQPEEAPGPHAAQHDAGQEEATSSRGDVGEPEQAPSPGQREPLLPDGTATSPRAAAPPHAVGPSEAAEAQLLAGGLCLPSFAVTVDRVQHLLTVRTTRWFTWCKTKHPSACSEATPPTACVVLCCAGLAAALPKGAAFCRRVGDDKVEAAWQAARESMVADYKSKRRMALRQQSAHRKRPRH